MATRRRAAPPTAKPATEITVEVPHGSSLQKVNALVRAALKQKTATDALDDRQLLVIRLETNGGGNGS